MTLLDLLVEKGYSKVDAEKIIRAGYVKVNGEEIILPSTKVNKDAEISVKSKNEWVSRGAYKLLHAIDSFKINFENLIVLDIGSSTGGFTQVALEKGAQKVFSLDVGTNQLDFKLRRDSRVVSLEKTNLKTITPQMFSSLIDIIVTDVSFISLKEVFKVSKEILKKGQEIIALIKPQYEANSNLVLTGGIVEKKHHKDIIEKVSEFAKEFGFKLTQYTESPIKGKKSKNIEYISIFEKG